MKKALFIDRDGTIIREPADEQIDSLEKLEFVPGAISSLAALSKLGFELVMVSNQDGLGTESFPEEDFWPAQEKMLNILEGEGVVFNNILIDKSFPEDNAPTRKPRTGMLTEYMEGSYDLAASFVIGDRDTDLELARNLGATGLKIKTMRSDSAGKKQDGGTPENSTKLEQNGGTPEGGYAGLRLDGNASEGGTPEQKQNSDIPEYSGLEQGYTWPEIVERIRCGERRCTRHRTTAETDVTVTVDLDGRLESRCDTGLKFFDHMLDQIPHHGGISLQISCKGDLEVDEHHTIEDVGIVLGETLKEALGNKRGIDRYGFALPSSGLVQEGTPGTEPYGNSATDPYGFALPMDESRAMVLLDLGGRSELVWDVNFTREYVGDVPTEMFRHFFKSLTDAMKATLHVKAEGENNHHLAEAVFKAFARTLRQATRRDPLSNELPSSKGLI